MTFKSFCFEFELQVKATCEVSKGTTYTECMNVYTHIQYESYIHTYILHTTYIHDIHHTGSTYVVPGAYNIQSYILHTYIHIIIYIYHIH